MGIDDRHNHQLRLEIVDQRNFDWRNLLAQGALNNGGMFAEGDCC
jgi:hypothetical protein